MDLWVREARLFKYGSGTGTNFSSLRGDGEPLSGGGRSSGLMWFLIIALGINFTYHRLLSHRSFKTHKIVEYAFSLLGILANTGSPLAWVMMHRQHHHYTDKGYDPHSPHEHGYKILFSFYDDKLFRDKPSAALMYARHMFRDKVQGF